MKINREKLIIWKSLEQKSCLLSILMSDGLFFCCSSVFEHLAAIIELSLFDANVLKLLEKMLYIYF